MKTVIIGTDLVYDLNGNLKPIEINTNINYTQNKIQDDVDVFDSLDLKNFIVNNSFNKITYIGWNPRIKSLLLSVSEELNLQFEEIYVGNTSVTIPLVEDSPDNLIIRQAYDITAIIDEEYCKNKVNFLNLIKNTEYSSQFAYMDSTNQIVSTITEIKDNGEHPNFILKAVNPNYDKNIYPKLFRVTTQEELNVILQNVSEDYFLMEYHFNTNSLFENSVTKIRKISLLYPPTLESIHIGTYTDLSAEKLNTNLIYDNQTYELDNDQRYIYVTKDFGTLDLPKLLDDDLVVMEDGSLKTGLDLQIGDYVKTISIPGVTENIDPDKDTISYDIDYTTFANNVEYTSNRVVGKKRVDVFVKMCNINFSDGTSWSDTITSKYLVVNEGIVKFKRLDNLIVNDVVLLINTTDENNVIIEEKTVTNVTIGNDKFSGFLISVEKTQLFLTKTSNTLESPSFAAIEHNYCYTYCNKNQCCYGLFYMQPC